MILLFVVAGGLQFLRSLMLQRIGDWIHTTLTTNLLPVALSHAGGNDNSNVQSLRDANALRQFISGPSLTTLMDIPWTVLYLGVLFVIHAWLGFLVTGGIVILFLLAWLNEGLLRQLAKKAGSLQIKGLSDLEFATRNTDVIEAMGMKQKLISRWLNTQAKAVEWQALANSRSAAVQGVTKSVRLILQILVTCISAWLAINGEVTIGAIIASSILASRALAPFEAAISSWKGLTDARAAYNRIQKTLQLTRRQEGISLPSPAGKLSVEGLTYALNNKQLPILRNITFQLEAGECLGIVGHSASGKTTLARLMAGIFAPTSGVVRLDGANVYTWPREEFGRFTGYLPQDVELFSGTIKDNIARLLPDALPEMIVEAAASANAHEMILRLPNGYETDIGTSGMALSAGQRQRIGLARAFFGNPRFLILDEPDANLDGTGKVALIQAIQKAKRAGITTVLISHRSSILQHTDKLLVLKHGTVESFALTRQLMPHASATLAGSA